MPWKDINFENLSVSNMLEKIEMKTNYELMKHLILTVGKRWTYSHISYKFIYIISLSFYIYLIKFSHIIIYVGNQFN